jgi:hypothetical protein
MTSEEAQVLNALQSNISGLNDIVLRGQIFRLALQVDNSTNATDDVNINSSTKRFLKKYADPVAMSFIEPTCKKIAKANTKFLHNFTLKLVVQEVVL